MGEIHSLAIYQRAGKAEALSGLEVRLSRERVSIAVVLALMVAALAMMALGFSGYRSPAHLWNSIFAAPEDGSWTAISIDGKPVEPERYRISIGNGEVTGGRDDCNDWSYDEEEAKDGNRMIISTLVGCPEGDPLREAYWSIVADPFVELISASRRLSSARLAGPTL